MPKALITGINGQDGSYLAELLLSKGYEVFGTLRRSSFEVPQKFENLTSILDNITVLPCNLDNHLAVYKLIQSIQPDECYHLAASSFVSYSFDDEMSIVAANFNSTHYLLSSIKENCPDCRFYLAGSSEMFGQPDTAPQNESTPFNPRSIYGISKLSSYYVVKNYREHHGLYACTGISYNHESKRRGRAFVTRKITAGVAEIARAPSKKIKLGNINAIRDWGYAPEYVEGMWRMLYNPKGPQDYVLATGIGHTVADFLAQAFSLMGIHDFTPYVEINDALFRPSEDIPLIGCATRIKEELGWQPKVGFEEIVSIMVAEDRKLAERASS